MSTQSRQDADQTLEFLSRIRRAMDVRQVSIRDLSLLGAVPYSSLRAYLDGRHTMPAEALGRIAASLQISADWLLKGKASLDPKALVDCLHVIEDVRVLSDFKVDLDACASMFYRLYNEELDRLFATPARSSSAELPGRQEPDSPRGGKNKRPSRRRPRHS